MDKENSAKKVFVGLSGGVDSSVAAYLLKNEKDSDGSPKYDVVGVYLNCWNKDGCNEKEAADAKSVAEYLDIPFYSLDLQKEYKDKVVDYMVDGYKKGITPNPDVMCNKEIKFGLFLGKALKMGADFIASGHYVRLVKNGEGLELHQAKDKSKDQSYFLWTLTQGQLKRSLFPIGDYTKKEVREIAKEVGLPTADKKDSQGICFIGEVSLKDFLGEYLQKKEGDVLNTEGEVIGTHDGAQFYTIGQRHGLGIGGGGPYYVADKDVKVNTVTLATKEDKELYQKKAKVVGINIISEKEFPKKVMVRVRYRQPLQASELQEVTDDSYLVKFDKPQEFIASGQSAVFYDKKGKMLGGGIIT